ncbi:MAG: energy transducer TonB [Geobacteraceae bacterium]|nr:energy transducer TonB [Geobacteraceae bacterium]
MTDNKIRNVVLPVLSLLLTILFLPNTSFAVDGNNSVRIFQDRIELLKRIHGDSYVQNNMVEHSLALDIPCEEFNACMLKDVSTEDKKNSYKEMAQVWRKQAGDAQACASKPNCSYIGASKFIELYNSNKRYRELLPKDLNILVKRLEDACSHDNCNTEKSNHGTFWLQPWSGAVTISIPIGEINDYRYVSYMFLIPLDSVNELFEITENSELEHRFTYIKDIIMKNLHYPNEAVKSGLEGKVVISFDILETGYVENIKIVVSSGYSILDENTINTVNRLLPFGKPPCKANIRIPIEYRL